MERRHLEKRVAINDRMVKMAQQMYELHKRRVLLHDEEVDEAHIEAFAEAQVREIDALKQEEAIVLGEINEAVESLRRSSVYDDEY
jgi:hypothetical protein